MKMTQFGVPAALVLAAVSIPAWADQASDKAALRKTYTTIDALAKSGDVAKVGVYMTSDFKIRLLGGQEMNKEQALQATAAAIKSGQMKAAPTKILSIRVTGNRAVVEAEGGGSLRQSDPQGQPHTVLVLTRTRDQWVRTGGAWKEKFSQQLTEEIRVDGRTVSKK